MTFEDKDSGAEYGVESFGKTSFEKGFGDVLEGCADSDAQIARSGLA